MIKVTGRQKPLHYNAQMFAIRAR